MSEYQYYEFAAVDRALTKREMNELRACSTRATITPTRFVNEYHWGDLKADPLAWMAKYFDAFLYLANWGTHRLVLRLPRSGLDLKFAAAYCAGESARVWTKGEHVFLQCWSEDESGSGWDEPSPELSVFTTLRQDLVSGDHRALYLAWLLGVQDDEFADEETEPPVPAGLGTMTGPLTAFARFLRIDDDLIASAAARSPELKMPGAESALKRWIDALPNAEKTELLMQQATDNSLQSRAELWRRFRRSQAADSAATVPTTKGRTVAELLAGAERRSTTRRRAIAAQQAAAKARHLQKAKIVREKHLAKLAGQEEITWRHIATLLDARQPAAYDQAIELLKDLRELATRQGNSDMTEKQITALAQQHARKTGLMKRLRQQGLIPHS